MQALPWHISSPQLSLVPRAHGGNCADLTLRMTFRWGSSLSRVITFVFLPENSVWTQTIWSHRCPLKCDFNIGAQKLLSLMLLSDILSFEGWQWRQINSRKEESKNAEYPHLKTCWPLESYFRTKANNRGVRRGKGGNQRKGWKGKGTVYEQPSSKSSRSGFACWVWGYGERSSGSTGVLKWGQVSSDYQNL